MREYFYSDGRNKFGPFSLNQLRNKRLSGHTLIWYPGLNNWVQLSQINELHFIDSKPSPGSKKQRIFLIILIIAVLALSFGSFFKFDENTHMYESIVASSYDDPDTDFQMYVDKFYRDLEFFGIFPKKPAKTIIKFAKLDQLDNITHFHAVSYGYEDDSLIEIYINPSTWKNFNKPMRYYLMYHELSHDILNLDDLELLPENLDKLMFPNISSFESLNMDDFIERSHAMFEEYGQNY